MQQYATVYETHLVSVVQAKPGAGMTLPRWVSGIVAHCCTDLLESLPDQEQHDPVLARGTKGGPNVVDAGCSIDAAAVLGYSCAQRH